MAMTFLCEWDLAGEIVSPKTSSEIGLHSSPSSARHRGDGAFSWFVAGGPKAMAAQYKTHTFWTGMCMSLIA